MLGTSNNNTRFHDTSRLPTVTNRCVTSPRTSLGIRLNFRVLASLPRHIFSGLPDQVYGFRRLLVRESSPSRDPGPIDPVSEREPYCNAWVVRTARVGLVELLRLSERFPQLSHLVKRRVTSVEGDLFRCSRSRNAVSHYPDGMRMQPASVFTRTTLFDRQVTWLYQLVSEGQLLADLAFADIVIWAPTSQQSFVAVSHLRPSSAATLFYRDVVESENPPRMG